MKITAVETTVVRMPMRIDGPTPRMGDAPRTSMDILLVRVDTDEGVTGWGEAFGHRAIPTTRTAIDVLIAPLCIGRDPAAIDELSLHIQHALHGGGRNGPVIYGLSGVDIALWDIAGKVAGLRSTACWGEPARGCARLREPPALRRAGRGYPVRRPGARARLSPRQGPRDRGSQREGGSRRRSVPISR